MVTTTKHDAQQGIRISGRLLRWAAAASVLFATLALGGCSTASTGGATGSEEATGAPQMNYHMAGKPMRVVVSRAAIESTPAPWVLDTPENAIRSYLDWVSYDYRVAQSDFGMATMGDYEQVRVDSYIQYNLQEKECVIDQNLTKISFGKSRTTATGTVVPATEEWTYRYISSSDPSKVIGGPYTAKYSSTYTLSKATQGWIVENVDVKPLGEVK